MKTKILHLIVAFCFLGSLSVKTVALNYTISFTGTGASSTVDSVIVENLTKGTKVTVPSGNVLNLSDAPNAVIQVSANDETIRVYPASANGKSLVSFFAKQAGSAQLNAFSLDGRKIAGLNIDLQAGNNMFELSLPGGVFLVQVTGNEYAYTAKMLNQTGTQGKPGIVYTSTEKPVFSSPQKTKSSTLGVITMAYTAGDWLLYTSFSGNSSTIVTDVPTGSKTTNFNFVACTDADGNHYKVVTIGTQTWMAENLKTTRYNDGTAIPLITDDVAWYSAGTFVTPGFCWLNNDAASWKNIYGAYYNWSSVNTGKLAPTGWHVPTDLEWSNLESYLIANGYNYGGSTSGDYIAKSLSANTNWSTFPTAGTIGSDLSKNNSTGFSAMPGGYRYSYDGFSKTGYNAYWWSSTDYLSSSGWYYELEYLFSSLDRYYDYFGTYDGFNVRCVKDN